MAAAAAGALQVTSYRLSKRAKYAESKGSTDDPSFLLSWDSDKLSLTSADKEEAHVSALSWQHVTGVWVSLRSRPARGFHLEITVETSHRGTEVDFVHVKAAMNGPGGEFLDFLQTSQPQLLKDGKAPAFATSRWACQLFLGDPFQFSVRGLRVNLGRCSIIFEVLFSLCFFAQLQHILSSKEAKLTEAVGQLWEDMVIVANEIWDSLHLTFMEWQVGNLLFCMFFSMPGLFFFSAWKLAHHTSNWLVLLMMMQHLFTVLFMLDGFARVIRGAVKSALTFHKAAKRVDKAIKKASSRDIKVAPAQAAEKATSNGVAPAEAAQAGDSNADTEVDKKES